MDEDVVVGRLVTGEIVVYHEQDAEFGTTNMGTPHALVNTPQGPRLVPLMPWATQGEDYTIEIASDKFLFHYPRDKSGVLIADYITATSKLDLSSRIAMPR